MMIHLKDASERCRKGSGPNMGNTFYQQANIDQIGLKTCQKLQMQVRKQSLVPNSTRRMWCYLTKFI